MQTTTSRFLYTISTLALVLFLGATPSHAQMQQESPFKVGVRGGLALSTFTGDAEADAEYLPGFTGGVFATYRFNSAFSVQPEVLYTVRGAEELDLKTTSQTENLDVTQQFVEIPVLFKLSAPLSPIQPRLFVGPSFNFLANTDVNGQEASDSFSDFEFGGVLGGEVAYDLGAGALDEIALDGRWSFGISELGDTSTNESLRNSGFVGTLSVRFNI